MIEPPFAELCAQLAPLPAVFVARFTSRLMEIKQPDDIWEELKSLHKLVQLNASRPAVALVTRAPLPGLELTAGSEYIYEGLRALV